MPLPFTLSLITDVLLEKQYVNHTLLPTLFTVFTFTLKDSTIYIYAIFLYELKSFLLTEIISLGNEYLCHNIKSYHIPLTD